jgi:hypothetical protein
LRLMYTTISNKTEAKRKSTVIYSKFETKFYYLSMKARLLKLFHIRTLWHHGPTELHDFWQLSLLSKPVCRQASSNVHVIDIKGTR